MNGDALSWNTKLIKNVFLPFEADHILELPLSISIQQDAFYWKHTGDGNFKVRSTYHLIRNNPQNHIGTSLLRPQLISHGRNYGKQKQLRGP